MKKSVATILGTALMLGIMAFPAYAEEVTPLTYNRIENAFLYTEPCQTAFSIADKLGVEVRAESSLGVALHTSLFTDSSKYVLNATNDSFFEAIMTDGFARVPDRVIRAYVMSKGQIEFTNEVLLNQTNILGTYQSSYGTTGTPMIRLGFTKSNLGYYKTQLPDTIAHEFGHFLYAKSNMSFSDDLNGRLQEAIAYVRAHDSRAYKDEDEAFALLYAEYCYQNDLKAKSTNYVYMMPENHRATIQEIEDLAITNVLTSKTSLAPGTKISLEVTI